MDNAWSKSDHTPKRHARHRYVYSGGHGTIGGSSQPEYRRHPSTWVELAPRSRCTIDHSAPRYHGEIRARKHAVIQRRVRAWVTPGPDGYRRRSEHPGGNPGTMHDLGSQQYPCCRSCMEPKKGRALDDTPLRTGST